MEQKSTASTTPMECRANITPNQTDTSNDPPPTKRAKQQPERDLTQAAATSNTTTNSDVNSDDHSSRGEQSEDVNSKQPLKDGIFNFYLPSEEEANSDPVENLEPNSASLKGSRTGGVWHKSLEESHSAQVKEITLLGHLRRMGRNLWEGTYLRYYQPSWTRKWSSSETCLLQVRRSNISL